MSVVAKAGLGVAALGGVGIAGCYAMGVFGKVTPETKVSETIDWTPLTLASDFSSAYTSGTVGYGYGKYFVATYGDSNSNKKMWEKLYVKYEEDKANALSDEFKSGKVSKAFEETSATEAASSGAKPLNKLCDEMYKKTESDSGDVNFSSTTDSEDRFKRARDILKYCSVLGQKPTLITTDDYNTENTIGKTKAGDNKLVKANDEANNGFWEAQEIWVKTLADLDLFFSPIKTSGSLKDKCKEAYEKDSVNSGSTATAEKPLDTNVVKYCSFDKEAS